MKVFRFKRFSLALVILCGTWITAFAQSQVSGKVNDAIEPLQGVAVVIKGTSRGAITDSNGEYSLSATKGDTIQFLFIGYVTQEIQFNGEPINVTLLEDTKDLEEVLVIGYGKVKKSDATGALTSVSSKDFNKGAIVSPTDLMTGKSAGVQITSPGGSPGSNSTIRIRGGASLTASNDPLIVVDGVPTTIDINSIDPNTIESFTILKDASSTAIYGARATNGVIIITTKKGKGGDKLRIDYSAQASVSSPSKYINTMTGDEYRKFVIDNYGESSEAAGLLGTANTNWQKEIYRSAFGQDHNLTFTGGKISNYIPYRVSGGYTNKDGILKTDNFSRTTASLMLTPKFLDNHLALTVNLKGAWINEKNADQDAIYNAINFDPTQNIYSGNSSFGGYTTWTDGSGLPINSKTPFNPVSYQTMKHEYTDRDEYTYNMQLNYKVHGFEDLSFNVNISEEGSDKRTNGDTDPNAPFSYNIDGDGNLNGGSVWDNTYFIGSKLLEMYTQYNKDLKKLDSKFDVQLGYSWQHYYNNGHDYSTNYNGSVLYKDKFQATELFLVSFFGRMNYILKDKYLFTATVRRDGTSRFSPDNRWGTFPAFAFAWKVNEESFLKDFEKLSTLKLRLGYGITGQQQISDNYAYLSKYTTSQPTVGYYFDGKWIETERPGGYDSNLKWEQTSTSNIGLDYGFWGDRLSGSIDYYYRKTIDLVNTVPVAAGTNLTNYITTNVGSLVNKGVEFAVTGRPIVNDKWYWEVGFNVTHNQNNITKLTTVDDPNYKGILTGGIQGALVGTNIQINSVGHPANSFYVYEQVYDSKGSPIEGVYVDQNNDGILNDEDKYISKSPDPKFYYGINSLLKYNNWSFSFQGRAQTGNYIYNNVSSNNGLIYNTYNTQGFLNNRVNPIAPFSKDNQALSDFYIQNASFFKMDNISVGYDFKSLMKGKIDLRLSAIAQNVFTITNYQGIDPEVFGGIDYKFYPRPQVFLLGVNVSFN